MTETPVNDTEVGYPKPDNNQVGLRVCQPPRRDAVTIDTDTRRQELQNERYEAWKERDELEIWGDDPGLGKTTNIAKGAEQRGDTLIFYFPQHKNAHEFQRDEQKPGADLHLKGPTQPIDDKCMDARVNDEPCEIHGDHANCSHMCSVFDRPKDDELREVFNIIAEERGTDTAHRVVDPHDDDEECHWRDQWETLEELKDRDDAVTILTVFNYMDSINTVGYNILDDIQNLLEQSTSLSRSDLGDMREVLQNLADDSAISSTITEITSFTTDVIDALDKSRRSDDFPELSDLDPPTINVEAESWVGRRVTDETDPKAEALAWLKHAYRETLLSEAVRLDGVLQTQADFAHWEYVPLGLDMVFAAAAEAGLPQDSVRRAIAATPGVEECPSCGTVSEFSIRTGRPPDDPTIFNERDAGKHVCDRCGWHEHEDPLTHAVSELPRATAWIGEEDRQVRDPDSVLWYQNLPLTSDLPDPSETLILDATPTKKKYALLFGLETNEVVITGDEPVTLNAEVIQITDGQYHQTTLEDASAERQTQFNRVIEKAAKRHDGVLVVSHQGNESFLKVEDHEWMYFHAGRGLDREEPEAVVIVGAPHANEEDLKRRAQLLAMDRSDVRVGGKEHSSRRNEDGDLAANPPIHRKYYYEDETGAGRAVATKHYTGLVGKLFRDTREHELVQLAHRHRPAISDEMKYIYQLTNVPTELPVDTLASLSELADPVYEQADVSEGVIRMLEICVELYQDGRPRAKDDLFYDWDRNSFTATDSQFHDLLTNHRNGPDVSLRQFRYYREELQDLGLLEQGEYAQQVGKLYQLDLPTSKQALLVLINNRYFEVDAFQRLACKIENADGSTEWLEWVEDQFDLPDEPANLIQT